MSRYIDTNVWCEDCKEYDKEHHNCPRFNRVIRTALEDAGMVRVVRCKECRYEDDCEQEVLLSEMYGEIADTAHITYCSYGEREGE